MNTTLTQSEKERPEAIGIGVSATLTGEPKESDDAETRKYNPQGFVDRLIKLAIGIRRISEDFQEADALRWDDDSVDSSISRRRDECLECALDDLYQAICSEIARAKAEFIFDPGDD